MYYAVIELSSVIIATCQQRKHPALALMAYFWKERHGFTIITQTGREEGRWMSSRRRNLFNLDNISAALDTMLFWSSQGSCDIMPHSHTVSKFPEDNSHRCPQTALFTPLRHACQFLLPGGCSSFSPPGMLNSMKMKMLEGHRCRIVRGWPVEWPETGHASAPSWVPQRGSRRAEG